MFISFFNPDFCLYLLTILNIIRASVKGEENTSSVNPPDILLTRYQHSKEWIDFKDEESDTDIPKRDGNDYIVGDTKSISGILLLCNASYPVYWVMTDVKPVDFDAIESNSEAIIDADGEWSAAEPKEFITYLELLNDASFTGLYTCRSVENANLSMSTYLFLPGRKKQAKTLLNAGDELNVGLNGDDLVIIPCKISRKNAEVLLAKDDGTGNWTTLTLKRNFDPKLGFTIDKSEVELIVGKYKCSVEEPSEEVIVNVVQESHKETPFPLQNEIGGTAHWGRRKGLGGGGIQCCSNSSTSPKLLVVTCHNLPECEMKKVIWMHLWPNITTTKTPGVTATSKSSADSCYYTRSYYGLFIRPFLIQCIGDGINISGQYATEFSSQDNDKMNFVLSSSIENTTYNEETSVRLRILRWKNYTTWRGAERHAFQLVNLNKTDLCTGDKFVISCCGLYYHHAIGRMQRIVWKNGTTTLLETPEKDEYGLDKYPYVKDFCYTYAYDEDNMEYLLTADENMSHFECIVPRWYDRKPTVKTIKLNIKEPKEPVIASAEDIVNVTYNENQLGLLQLECKLSQGTPRPQMAWTKDTFVKLNQTDKHWSMINNNTVPEHRSLNLLFMRASKSIVGRYECAANNSEGKALKIFIVNIIPRTYLDYWIALIVFGGFFVIIICCGLRISTLEKKMSPKQVGPIKFIED